ncbi:MAG: metallopeptidase family protein [Patescibacteria group bacterium]|nr:metallopeptidase family protein [Patescibacteria group bacterium]
MRRKDFEQFIHDSIQSLPPRAREAMENVMFVVEDKARRKRIGETNIKRNEVLLGLYEGIPKTKRSAGYFGVLPDRITIFQKPLEELSGGNKGKLKKLVGETVLHEVGHHLGLDEREIRALEAKRKKQSYNV